jgi:hypothetical protein
VSNFRHFFGTPPRPRLPSAWRGAGARIGKLPLERQRVSAGSPVESVFRSGKRLRTPSVSSPLTLLVLPHYVGSSPRTSVPTPLFERQPSTRGNPSPASSSADPWVRQPKTHPEVLRPTTPLPDFICPGAFPTPGIPRLVGRFAPWSPDPTVVDAPLLRPPSPASTLQRGTYDLHCLLRGQFLILARSSTLDGVRSRRVLLYDQPNRHPDPDLLCLSLTRPLTQPLTQPLSLPRTQAFQESAFPCRGNFSRCSRDRSNIHRSRRDEPPRYS